MTMTRVAGLWISKFVVEKSKNASIYPRISAKHQSARVKRALFAQLDIPSASSPRIA
jgi:hypothetical protein